LAAVLLPLLWETDDPTVIFTKRTEHLEHHRGQVSFPGGHHDPGDEDMVATALREAEEEIGLPRDHVEILGRLDDHLTRTSIFHLTPLVASVRRPSGGWTPDPHEVAAVIEVPLSHLREDGTLTTHTHFRRDGTHVITPAFTWDDQIIWGATADMLLQLFRLIRD